MLHTYLFSSHILRKSSADIFFSSNDFGKWCSLKSIAYFSYIPFLSIEYIQLSKGRVKYTASLIVNLFPTSKDVKFPEEPESK